MTLDIVTLHVVSVVVVSIVTAVFVLLLNLIVDVVYVLVDPRINYASAGQ